MTTTDGMTTNNTGSSQGNYDYWLCMFYSTVNNIQAISLRPYLSLEKIGVLWETNYLYLICYMHIGHFLSEGLCLTPQKLDLYFYTPGFLALDLLK
jgi:hypothetical protein